MNTEKKNWQAFLNVTNTAFPHLVSEPGTPHRWPIAMVSSPEDAQLIARAPEMESALQDVLKFLGTLAPQSRVGRENLIAVRQIVREALGKESK